jgi:hypothetical protein
MTAPGMDRLVSPEAPLDLIANDLVFGEGPAREAVGAIRVAPE